MTPKQVSTITMYVGVFYTGTLTLPPESAPYSAMVYIMSLL
jgi:hypothetical protein